MNGLGDASARRSPDLAPATGPLPAATVAALLDDLGAGRGTSTSENMGNTLDLKRSTVCVL